MAKDAPGPLPYRWHPTGTRETDLPEVGQILAFRHMAWRVTEVRLIPEIDWDETARKRLEMYTTPEARFQQLPRVVICRPVHITSDDPRSRDFDVHLSRRSFRGFDAYPDEHYPVCAKCSEPLPCRDEMARRGAEDAAKRMGRYELPGVCPACEEPVTGRQKTVTFEENLEIPCGPPVTFHLRCQCRHAAIEYERRWAAADPDHRATRLSCPGHVQRHQGGDTECSQDPVCPGAKLPHRAATACYPGGACLRCKDAVEARNAAGDWTVWA